MWKVGHEKSILREQNDFLRSQISVLEVNTCANNARLIFHNCHLLLLYRLILECIFAPHRINFNRRRPSQEKYHAVFVIRTRKARQRLFPRKTMRFLLRILNFEY